MTNASKVLQREMTEPVYLAAMLKAGVRLEWRPLVRVPAKLADGMGGACLQALASGMGQSVLAEDGAQYQDGKLYLPAPEIDGEALERAMQVLDRAAMI